MHQVLKWGRRFFRPAPPEGLRIVGTDGRDQLGIIGGVS